MSLVKIKTKQKMKKIVSIILLITVFVIISCNNGGSNQIPKDVLAVLDSAKGNKGELLKVLDNYQEPKDSLKLKAAYFLISNMAEHAYSKAKLVDSLDNYIDFNILDYPDYTIMVAAWDSIENIKGEIDYKRDTLITDLSSITANFLIENIDLAFNVNKYEWNNQLNFNEFCEYILPYRGSSEPLENWRESLFKKYSWVLDSIKDKSDPVEAAILLNNEIKSWYSFDSRFYRHPTDLGFAEMLDVKMGRCEDMTNLAIYALRSQGIPVMSDYTPYWPNTGNNHAWNAVIDKNNKVVIFMGGGANPYEYKLGNKKSKVYRKTFASQKNSLYSIKQKWEKVPPYLSFSNYTDVTKDYIEVADIKLQLTKEKPDSVNFAYICVFNSGEWKAIHWSKITKGKKVNFTDMGNDIAYLPAYYKNKEIIPAGNQFIFSKDNKIIELKADTINTQLIKLYSTTKKYTIHATDEIRKASFKPNTFYELFYWDDKWISLGKKKSINNKFIQFKNVPTNTLFWLVQENSNKEERIFYYDGDGIKWW